MPLVESITRALRSNRFRTTATTILCCLVLVLGVRNVSQAFLRHVDHPGWDFVLRYGEVSCLANIHVDPYDIYSNVVQDNLFRPYKQKFELDSDAMDFRWVCGYSPWEYTLILPFSFLPIRSAAAIYKGFELGALAIVLCFAFRRSKRIGAPMSARLILCSSFLLVAPLGWDWAFKYDNYAILFCAGAVALVVSLDKGWQILAGLAWAFLMVKPQQGIWFAIPLLFRRQFKTVGVAVATCLAASIPPAILCGKSPLDLILEMPKFRYEGYWQTSLFPPRIYTFANEFFFPRFALFLGLFICLVFCLWASWKLRKEKNWFIALQPTFFCVCAGYPLWNQDWLYCFFPIFFLLETWANSGKYSHRIRTTSFVLAIALTNPLTWARYNFGFRLGTILSESEVHSYAIWGLFSFLLFLVQSRDQIEENGADLSDNLPNSLDSPSGKPSNLFPHFDFRELVPAFILLTTCLAVLVPVAFLKNGSFLGCDDANIVFGYAENLCRGHGISYAQNGVHCEGTTSLLWLLLCSACFKLRLNEPGVLAVSLALLLSAQWMWLNVLARLLPARSRSPDLFCVYVVIVLSSAGYVTWMSITLMDTVLWGFMVAWMSLSLLRKTESSSVRDRLVAAIPFALAPWARPESMLVVPFGLTLSFLFRCSRNKTVWNEIIWGIVFLLSLAVLTGFRLLYFGYPFPNTFYAKVSPSFVDNIQQGTQYLLEYVRSGSFTYLAAICFVVTIAIVILRLFRKTRARTAFLSEVEFLWLWCLVLILPPVFAGGDHFGYSRVFQPVWPLLSILLVSVFASFASGKRPRASGVDWASIVVLFAFVLFSFFSSGKKWGNNPAWSRFSPIDHEFEIAETGRNIGRILSEMFDILPEKPMLGVISSGAISRTYQGRIVDLMGFNSIDVAHHHADRKGFKPHAAFEPNFFDSLNVDIMPFSPDSFHSRALKGILETESFVSNWRCGRIRKDATGEETPPFFVENGFLDLLLSTGDFSFRDSYRFEDGSWKEIKEAVATD